MIKSRAGLNSLEQSTFNELNAGNNFKGELGKSIQNNLKEFSVAKMDKVWFELKDLDDENQTKVLDRYNTYLETEKATANAAFENIKKLQKTSAKSLKWVTMKDDRVRDTHKELHGLTRPINDPIWSSLPLPATEYNCRCHFEELNENISKGKKPKNINKIEGIDNPMVSGIIFNKNHSYFK